MESPLDIVKKSIAEKISRSIGIEIERIDRAFEKPKREEFGDLTIVTTKIGRDIDPEEIAKHARESKFIDRVERIGIYVNLWLKRREFTELVLDKVFSYRDRYGVVEYPRKRIVIEFVSANPIHPLHIGTARNAALGQALYNMLKRAGHEVQRRFYINDMGREVAVLVYGVEALGELEPPPNTKIDHWLGAVYAMTSLLIELKKLRDRLATATSDEEKRGILKEMDRTLNDIARLKEVYPDLFDKLSRKIMSEDPEKRVSEIAREYEKGNPEIKKLVRRVVNACLEGIRETLKRFGVEFDVWDWESDLVWSGEVSRVIDELRKLPSFTVHRGVPAVTFDDIASSPEIRDRLRIPRSLEIPPLILLRSDGTTLYTVRDIAYSLKKFREFSADTVINVIGSEQILPQAQIRLALYMLGYKREAENLIHYTYEMVNIVGAKMSSRRGRIVTLDEVLDEAKIRALKELEARGHTPDEDVAERIAIAAVKFALLSVSPQRPVKFSWESVLNFERNSAPYLLYTYARCCGVMRKAREYGIEVEPEKLLREADISKLVEDDKRWRLIKLIAEYPEIMRSAIESLDPSTIAVYLLRLADEFNSWYDVDPIIHEENEGLRKAKLALLQAVSIVVKSALELLGIEPLEKI